MSANSERSMPQPTAGPLTAAITGRSHSRIASAAGVGVPRTGAQAIEGGPLLAEHDLLHVVAAAEGRIGAGEDDGAHLRVALRFGEGLLELAIGGAG